MPFAVVGVNCQSPAGPDLETAEGSKWLSCSAMRTSSAGMSLVLNSL